MTEPAPGRKTAVGRDPINIDPIGNDPLDLSDAPPRKDDGPNRSFLGWTGTATTFFTAAVVLGVIFVVIILALTLRTP